MSRSPPPSNLSPSSILRNFSPLPARILPSEENHSLSFLPLLTAANSTILDLHSPSTSQLLPLHHPFHQVNPHPPRETPAPFACGLPKSCRSSPLKALSRVLFTLGSRGEEAGVTMQLLLLSTLLSPASSPALCVNPSSSSVSNHTFHSFLQPSLHRLLFSLALLPHLFSYNLLF